MSVSNAATPLDRIKQATGFDGWTEGADGRLECNFGDNTKDFKMATNANAKEQRSGLFAFGYDAEKNCMYVDTKATSHHSLSMVENLSPESKTALQDQFADPAQTAQSWRDNPHIRPLRNLV